MVMEDDIVLPGDYNYSHWSIAVPKDAHVIFLNTYVLEAPGDLRSTVYGAVPLGPKQSCPGEFTAASAQPIVVVLISLPYRLSISIPWGPAL
jgi:hypothetical protein